ncbi:U3 small nucleolar RNA-associated protein 11 [Ascodesmis nigricans]|uniref:U3 small nucleolar RNA-associated protein 11 n=1 Tax=Ascodesmis nigricans TaxID=341454 RepID=A0A4S2N6M3_9PEZI|nr:U3 small nucleolar RNA-associated protein 11 [Ascodesmis nigricans]
MSSSMRNAVQRRNHKERSQPAARAKWGLLEKRKDYQARAHDYNRKKKTLKSLSSLAAARNPDEFYFRMTSTTQRQGKVAKNTVAKQMDQDEVKLLKTQDAGYLRMQAQQERRKIEDLEGRLAAGFGGGGDHMVFVEEKEEAESFEPSKFFDTPEELLGRRQNRVTHDMLKDGRLQEMVQMAMEGRGAVGGESTEEKRALRKEERELKKRQRMREREYRELKARMEREKDLKRVEAELDEQRAKMAKGASSVKNKWAKERKR